MLVAEWRHIEVREYQLGMVRVGQRRERVRDRIACLVMPNPQAPDFHINNINAYHSHLKEWLRPFHGVATKNLPNYLGWRRTLEALGQKIIPEDFTFGAIGFGQQSAPL